VRFPVGRDRQVAGVALADQPELPLGPIDRQRD